VTSGRRPPTPNAAALLIVLGGRLREAVDAALAEHGIAFRHLSALGHLAADEGISYSELARRAAVTAQSMQATLARLEQLGMVERVGGTGQGQRARLSVTPAGQALRATASAAISAIEERLLGSLSADDAATVRRLLTELFLATGPAPNTSAGQGNSASPGRGQTASRPPSTGSTAP